jgi:cytochrome P450
MPPRVSGTLSAFPAFGWLGSGFALLRDPTALFARSREQLGDTFVVDAFGYRLFCVFSASAVRSLYALPERVASKGVADYLMLRHKVPDELFAGRRNFPHDLFGREDVEGYLDNVEEAVRLELDELGESGRFEAFALTRRLVHRIGLASWAGVECASARRLNALIPQFDRLDAAESFVHPSRAFVAWATGKRRERAALAAIEATIASVLDGRARSGRTYDDFLARISASWADAPEPARRIGIARDVALIHLGSQSNLYAAMAWTLVNLLAHPSLLEAVRSGDTELLERCTHESIRVAQRSITLRRVQSDVEIDDGRTRYRVSPGVFVTTTLAITNTGAVPELDRFDPEHYEGRRLKPIAGLAAPELVSTFGHGRHSCPAQRFSVSAIRVALTGLLARFELEPQFAHATPLRAQIGGVARAAAPCVVAYRKRRSA